jgi:ParB-like chromosome segregation protein Spo0J
VYERELDGGRRTYQEVADRFGVTRAAVSQYLAIVKRLPDDVVRAVEAETSPTRLRALSMKRLVRIARLSTEEARRAAVTAVFGAR